MRFPSPVAAIAAFVLSFALSACGGEVKGAATSEAPSESKTEKESSRSITIAQEKQTVEVDECNLLTMEEIGEIIEATPEESDKCYMSFTDPDIRVTIALTSPIFDIRDELVELEVGGNSAYQLAEKRSGCEVFVILTDDKEEFDAALRISVRAYDKADLCGPALKLATAVFEKLPNT